MNQLFLRDILTASKSSIADFDNLIAVGDAEISGKTVKVKKSGGFKTKTFKNASSAVSIDIKIKALKPITVSVGYVKNDGKIGMDGINPMYMAPNPNGEVWVRKNFDASNLAVYCGAESFFIQIESNEENEIAVGDACVWQRNELELLDIYENDLEKMILKVENRLAKIAFESANNSENIAVSPNGNKFIINVDDFGNLFTTPLIPNKVLFVGNSLTLGMGSYGMCATDPQNDYVYHVTEFIKSKNPNVSVSRVHGGPFEQLEREEDFDYLWNVCHKYTNKPMKDSFSDDVDLIIIQLGENTNTFHRNEILKANIDKFISGVKTKSPKARIVWVHGFFNENISGQTIIDACNRWRIGQLCIKDLYTRENCAVASQTYVKDDGTVEKVKEGWIEHPGNLGMKRIADRIINFLKL